MEFCELFLDFWIPFLPGERRVELQTLELAPDPVGSEIASECGCSAGHRGWPGGHKLISTIN